jgi:uncharacterized protein (TIGR02246 family)
VKKSVFLDQKQSKKMCACDSPARETEEIGQRNLLVLELAYCQFLTVCRVTNALVTTGDKDMEHTQIQATIDANSAAISAGNMDAILATYEPEALLVGGRGMKAVGSPALRKAFEGFLGMSPKITMSNAELLQTGDVALHTYDWSMTGNAPDGSVIEQNGKAVIVLRKQADGRWLMVIDNPFGHQVN